MRFLVSGFKVSGFGCLHLDAAAVDRDELVARERGKWLIFFGR